MEQHKTLHLFIYFLGSRLLAFRAASTIRYTNFLEEVGIWTMKTLQSGHLKGSDENF